MDIDGDLAALRTQLPTCQDAPTLGRYLLLLEAAYCDAGEGLPKGAQAGDIDRECGGREHGESGRHCASIGTPLPESPSPEARRLPPLAPPPALLTLFLPSPSDADDVTMAALLGEEPPARNARPEEQDDAQGGYNAAAAVKVEPGAEVKAEAMEVEGERQQGSAQPPATQQQQQQRAEGEAPSKPPLHPAVAKLQKADSMQPSSAGLSQSGGEGGGTETEAGTVEQAAPLVPVRALGVVVAVGGGSRQRHGRRLPGAAARCGLPVVLPVYSACVPLTLSLQPRLPHRQVTADDDMDDSDAGAGGGGHGGGAGAGASTAGQQNQGRAGRRLVRHWKIGGLINPATSHFHSLAHPTLPTTSPTRPPAATLAEHTFLREKRMRKPARLWRSARERAVWLRMARAATTAEQVSYSAYILCDR